MADFHGIMWVIITDLIPQLIVFLTLSFALIGIGYKFMRGI